MPSRGAPAPPQDSISKQENRQHVTILTNLLISLFERHSLYVLDTAFSVPLIIGQVIKHKKQNKICLKDYIQTPDYHFVLFFFCCRRCSIFVFIIIIIIIFLEDTLAHGDKNRESCCILYRGVWGGDQGAPRHPNAPQAPPGSQPPQQWVLCQGERAAEPPPARGNLAGHVELRRLLRDWLKTETCRTARSRRGAEGLGGVKGGGRWGRELCRNR